MRCIGRIRLVTITGQVVVLGVLLWLVIGMGSAPTAAADMQIDIQGFAFNPDMLTIPVGTKVTWANKDSATHTVTSDSGAFNSNNLPNGSSFSFTFNQAGTFPYHCSIHTRMVASITVTGGGAPSAAGAPAASTAAPGAVLPQTGAAQRHPDAGIIVALTVVAVAAVALGVGVVLRRRDLRGGTG